MEKSKLLFLCTGNSARSQMAEGLLRHLDGAYFEAHSAGLAPQGVNRYAARAMAERGIDIGGQSSKHVDVYMGREDFGYLVTVCADADEKCPAVFLGQAERLHWPFEDPAAFEGSEADRLAKFREVRGQIEAKLRGWLEEQGIRPA